jgi:hypothetical protein
MESRQKTWDIIAKVEETRFIHWHAVNDMLRLMRSLDKMYPDWRFVNVYEKGTRVQVANYTKHRRATSKHP